MQILPRSALIVAALVALTNPGYSAEGGEAEAGKETPATYTITIVEAAREKCDQAFDPPVLTIPAGSTVVWINKDQTTHTVVSGEGEDPCNIQSLPPKERVIDGHLFQNMSYRKTFHIPGVYLFMCHLPMHRMEGKIIVQP